MIYNIREMVQHNEQLGHLQSFRAGDTLRISAAKTYFDTLSHTPPLFLKKTLGLLNLEIIPREESNLILLMTKNMLKASGTTLTQQEVVDTLVFLLERLVGDHGSQSMIQVIVVLLSLIQADSLLQQTIQIIIRMVFSLPSVKVLMLLCMILKQPLLKESKFLPFVEHNFGSLPLLDCAQYPKYYCTLLLHLSSKVPGKELTVTQTLLLMEHASVETCEHLSSRLTNQLKLQDIQCVVEFLSQRIFPLKTPFDEGAVGSLNVLFSDLLYVQHQVIKRAPSKQIAITSQHVRAYFSWLAQVFETYRNRVVANQTEEDQMTLRNIFGKLEAYSYAYPGLKHIITPGVNQVIEGINQNLLDSVKREAGYFILARFITLAVEGLNLNNLLLEMKSPSLGCIVFLRQMLQTHTRQTVINRRRINTAMQALAPNTQSLCHLETIIRIVFLSPKHISSNLLTKVIEGLQGFSQEQQFSLYSLLASQFSSIAIDFTHFQLILNVTEVFNSSTTFIRTVYLQLLNIVIVRYQFSFLDFAEMWSHIQKFRLQDVHMDVFCKVLTSLVRVYNQEMYRLEGFPEYCQNIYILASRGFQVFQLAMEIINLPTNCFRLMQRFNNMLVDSTDQANEKVLDILEVYTILYPVTAKLHTQNILSRLPGVQYYRFYARLQPKFPPKSIDFDPNNVVQLKWVIMSHLNRCERRRATDESREDINSLVDNFQGLGLGISQKQLLKQLSVQLGKLADNQEHWLDQWRNCTCKKMIQRDFKLSSKESILRRCWQALGSQTN